MQTQSEILRLSILHQRSALFKLHKQFGLTRIDVEVLVFSTEKNFFTLYDLQRFYCHTNIQQLQRSLSKLATSRFIQIILKGVKNKPTVYTITKQGKDALRDYYASILDNNESQSPKNITSVGDVQISGKSVGFSNNLLRHNIYFVEEN